MTEERLREIEQRAEFCKREYPNPSIRAGAVRNAVWCDLPALVAEVRRLRGQQGSDDLRGRGVSSKYIIRAGEQGYTTSAHAHVPPEEPK